MFIHLMRRNGQTVEQLWRSDEDANVQEWRSILEPTIEAIHAIVEPRTVK